ncbi:hypothetical protein C4B63_237g29 [Trypanosoma cruzi]|uniref:Endonuclease/exonuclease/phosphatase domain-containing protein n=1 Tax=Trypanosoma cruzi TaxID=5693 RepID=A0A2V2UM27_TRYCR|nr:hypothetical protein C4B63_237g29 [Trypanosoma cruzi]
MTEEGLDGQFCAGGPQTNGADVKAHTEAWNRSIPSDPRGDTIARRCIENVLQVVNSGECTRYARRQGTSAPNIALSKDCAVTHWAAQPSPDSDHCMILLDGLIGDDDALAVVPQSARTSLAWKKASQNKRGGKISQLCRIPQELTSMDSTERHVTSQIQKAARATVPERNRQPSPLWSPGSAKLES